MLSNMPADRVCGQNTVSSGFVRDEMNNLVDSSGNNSNNVLSNYVIVAFSPKRNNFNISYVHNISKDILKQLSLNLVCDSLEELARSSAREQGLSVPITTSRSSDNSYYNRNLNPCVASSLNDTNFMLFHFDEKDSPGFVCVGFIRFGLRDLYFDHNGTLTAFPMTKSVLDFHSLVPRSGIGKTLFNFMLAQTGTSPEEFAYDLPSRAMHSFLRKHYGLRDSSAQHNKFTLFSGFFHQFENRKN